MDDLNRAVGESEAAVHSIPRGSPINVVVQNTLSTTLIGRYEWIGMLEDFGQSYCDY